MCEGLDDFILRVAAKELFPKKLDEQNVSIVSVGGKDKLTRLVKLVLKLGINCFVFADFDFLLRDRGEERKRYGDDVKAHESVVSLGEAFFRQSCTFGEFGGKVYGRLQRLRSEIKAAEEEAFYTARTLSEITHQSVPLALSYLRSKGLCILSGEIENCSLDKHFVSPEKKLSLDKVFDISERLSSGSNTTDLFDTSEIRDFLAVVLQ